MLELLLETPLLIVAILALVYAFNTIQVLSEYERGVIFRLGKLLPQVKGPGLCWSSSPSTASCGSACGP
jgi:regulator of protease activity HflC (stomatin/prohibitin superfamily)